VNDNTRSDGQQQVDVLTYCLDKQQRRSRNYYTTSALSTAWKQLQQLFHQSDIVYI